MPDVKLSRDVPGARAVGGGTDAGHCPHPFDLCESPVPLPLKVRPAGQQRARFAHLRADRRSPATDWYAQVLVAPVLLLVVPLLFVFRCLPHPALALAGCARALPDVQQHPHGPCGGSFRIGRGGPPTAASRVSGCCSFFGPC